MAYFAIILRILLVLGLISLIITLLILDVNTGSEYSVSAYGIMVILYLTSMITLSRLNRNKLKRIITKKTEKQYLETDNKKIACLICGYRESPNYFTECLKSIYFNKDSLDKVILVIDGNNPKDNYMVSIFLNIFQSDSKVINLDVPLEYIYLNNKKQNKNKNKNNSNKKHGNTHINIINVDNIVDSINEDIEKEYLENGKLEVESLLSSYTEKFICITQPHKGKRHAMYTGFRYSLLHDMDLTITVDSDTIFENDTVLYLKKSFNDSRVGGATGNLQIFNNNNLIGYLSYLRYWFAFNLERAYGSYYGGVLCLSGPISCYRNSILKDIIDTWVDQTFLGLKCTYGDDRHLTNKVLELGYDTIYNPYAIAYTETPETFNRFVKQQIRWTKSGYRESLWVLKFLHKRNILMTLDLTYQIVYPFIIFGLLLYTIWRFNILSLVKYLWLIFGLSFIRGLYASIITKKYNYMLFYNYSLVYTSIIMPIKLYALCTLKDTNWGNIGRYKINYKITEWIAIFLWNICLLTGIIVTFCMNDFNNIYIGLTLSLGFIYLLGMIYVYNYSRSNYSNIYKEIESNKYITEYDNNIDKDIVIIKKNMFNTATRWNSLFDYNEDDESFV